MTVTTPPDRYDSDPVWVARYPPGVPARVDVPEVSLGDVLRQAVDRHGSHPAIDFYGSVTTYEKLADEVHRAARALLDLGVGKGDRVAIALPSCPQAVVAFYAVVEVGAIAVELNPLYTHDELEHTFTDHSARVAIVWDKLADVIASMPVEGLQVLTVDVTRDLPRTKRWALRLPVPAARRTRAALTARTSVGTPWHRVVAAVRDTSPLEARATGEDVAVLLYTGGTTGVPKAAMLTHRNLAANVEQSAAWVPELRHGEEVFYGILPMFHAYGVMLCILSAVRVGACTVLFPRFDVDQVIEAMGRRPATFLPGVPPIYDQLARAAEEGRVDLTSIRWGLSGAMPLPPELVERFERLSGGTLVEGYGMTETSPITVGNPVGPTRRPGSVGVPFPSTEVRVVDPEDPSTDRPTGEPGELLVRGPQVFVGYWNRPEETERVLLGDGWLRTGDVATIDAAGFVTIVDRLKDLIITGGFNVHPSEVEDVLRTHSSVEDVAVVGLPGTAGSEDVVAAVVLADGHDLDVAALRAHAREHLAGYKVPRDAVVVEDLPRSAIGKVLHKDVRADVAARLKRR